MEPKPKHLPPGALRILAEGLAFVGLERPLLSKSTPKRSALLMLSAYLRAHNPDSSVGSHRLKEIQQKCELTEKCKQLIEHKHQFGTELGDYEECLNMIMN